jgi:type I restriction enzyme S subunit
MTFEAKRLGDIAEIIGGGTPSTKDAGNWDGDIPWLTPKDLSSFEGIYVDRGSRSITEQGLKSSSAKMLPAGAVLYTSRAPIGYVAIASNAISTNQGFKSLILKDGYVPEFVFYLLKASKPEIESHASGGTFAEISAKALSEVVLLFPPKVQQDAIAKLLKSFDEKIASNVALCKILEDIAQTIFKSWFIDFDPVNAKMAGERPAGMDAETALHFPDSKWESELGEIPKGWNVKSIGDISVIQGGKMLSRDEFRVDGKFPIFGGAGVMGSSNMSNAEGFIITVGRVGAYCGQFFYHSGAAWVNNNASRIIPLQEISGEWVYLFLKSFDIESIKKGAAQPFVSNSDLANSKLIMPPITVIARFTEIVRPIFEQSQTLNYQAHLLSNVRDSLLPRLIAGELQIPEDMLAS